MDLLADYASSDEDDHEMPPPPPVKPAYEDSLSKSTPKHGGVVGSLPPPKFSLFNSLPPPKSQSIPNPKTQLEAEHRSEADEVIAGNAKLKSSSSSLFSSLPRPKSLSSSSSASSGAKKVVQFKPPMITNSYSRSLDEEEDEDDEGEEERKLKKSREKISTSSAASFLSSIPAPRHSATLGALPSASGMGRRLMLEASVPASNVSTGNDADVNPNVGYSNNQSNDANYAYSTWGSEGTANDDGANPESRNYGDYDHSTSLGVAYPAYDGASTEVSTAGVNPNAGSYEAVDYSFTQGHHVDYSNYGGGYSEHGNNLQYENNWGNLTALPEASGVVENALSVLGKRGRKDVPPEIVEVNQDELMKNRPREDQVKMTGIAFGPAYQPASTKGKPTKLHKRKHQIGSLYFDMRQKESELAERRSRGFQTKAQTQGKYGW